MVANVNTAPSAYENGSYGAKSNDNAAYNDVKAIYLITAK